MNPPAPRLPFAPAPRMLTRLALALAVLLVAACTRDDRDDGPLVLSGNIEAIDAQLAFKLPGRVAARLVSEGETVRAGQPVARLDAREQEAELALRQAELAAAEAALAELEAGSRPQEIAAAAAAVQSAEAARDRARLEFERQQGLFRKAVISDRELEAARADFQVAEARVHEATERLKLVEAGPRTETIAQARARVAQARAAVTLATTRLDETQLVSPLDGTVLIHHIEAGEYVSPGTPIITVAELAQVWVRVYLNQTDLGRIRHGQAVEVRTDTFPDRVYPGTIGFIAAEAEFTPRAVQTHQERVKLVYRLKVDVPNPDDELKPGMPADVFIPAP